MHERLYVTQQIAQEGFVQFLWHSSIGRLARDYCRSRGITATTARQYGLGYAPSRAVWDAYLRDRGVTEDMADEAGLMRAGRGEEPSYFRYASRLTFPFRDIWGRTIGHAGRIIFEQGQRVKYTNSPNSPIFQKKEILYGFHEARAAIQSAGFMYLVEGYMDVLAMVQRGKRNVVACCGTAVSDAHLHLCRVLGVEVHTIFDADDAGKKATTSCTVLARTHGVRTANITLPDGLDPGEWFTQHAGFPAPV